MTDLYAEMAQYVSGSTNQWRDHACDRQLLLGPAETTIDLEYREPGGAKKAISILRPHPDSLKDLPKEVRSHLGWTENVYSKHLDSGWGYIRFTSFSFGDVERTVERFDEALDSVFDAPGLIIDLRGNGGGLVYAVPQIAGRFVDEPQTMGFFSRRVPGKRTVYELPDETTGSYSSKLRLLAKPREDIYTGPVVILIDQACFSACESFSGGVQALNRALLVGPAATGGGSGWVGGLELPSGAIISFSYTVAWLPNGQQVEGHGVGPDILVRERAGDFASGRDRVLERAIKALEQGDAPPLVSGETE
jgi:carboxyl-terminal processing protease